MTNRNDVSTYGTAPSTKEQNYPNTKEKEAIFILCDTCYWSATYITQFMLPAEDRCPSCQNIELSSFPILPNESFISNYSEKRGLELEFKSDSVDRATSDIFDCY
ncbi:MAG: hypothetical protein WA667_04160 [Candidatus Nitrosopolaris sp.]